MDEGVLQVEVLRRNLCEMSGISIQERPRRDGKIVLDAPFDRSELPLPYRQRSTST